MVAQKYATGYSSNSSACKYFIELSAHSGLKVEQENLPAIKDGY